MLPDDENLLFSTTFVPNRKILVRNLYALTHQSSSSFIITVKERIDLILRDIEMKTGCMHLTFCKAPNVETTRLL